MIKFRFIGDPSVYDWDELPIVGKIYPENYYGTKNGVPYKPLNYKDRICTEIWISSPEDWEEVFEDKELINQLDKEK